MSKKKTAEPEITDKLISEIENISEKDIETLNTDKLNDLFFKTCYVHTMKFCNQSLTNFRRVAKLDEYMDKLETDRVSKSDELSAANELNLLQVLSRREKYLRKNVEDFKKEIPELLDNLEKSKLYYERREREKNQSLLNNSGVSQRLLEKLKQDAMKKIKKK